MSDEHQKLMHQISSLAGQINRAKNQQAGVLPGKSPTFGPSRVSTVGRSDLQHGQQHHTMAGRAGYRIAKPVHRNRSLVVKHSQNATQSSHAAAISEESAPSWVTKSDRHLQLINATVFQEKTEARSKAIQQTQLQKEQRLEHRESAQIFNHLRHTANASPTSANPASVTNHEISVDGIRFRVANNGRKLVKFPGDLNDPKATPKIALIGGVKFYRSKNGNMYRQAIAKAYRQSASAKKINVTCRVFSNTGSCPKGPMCRYIHDPSKVAACKELLQKGKCAAGSQCDLSHELSPERTPHCVHYAKGNCRASECPYTHRILLPGALICRPFGLYGYCDKGISCPDRHVFECPDFSNKGFCKTKGCRLPHRERASVLRKATAALEKADSRSDEDDLSSDDGKESVSTDDVDSDEVEEFAGREGSVDLEKDFISLS